MSHIIIKLSLFLFLLPMVGKSQAVADLIDIAKNNNLELKALQREYEAALEIAPQLSQLPNPEVSLGGFVAPVETRLGAQSFRIGASQMFPWFGTLDAKAEVAMSDARALHERVASRALELSYEVKAAYYQWYELDRSQTIIRRNLNLLKVLRQLALTRVESGKGSAADVLRVDLKIGEMEKELTILERTKDKPLADINQVLNRPLSSPIRIQDSLTFTVLPYNKDTLASYIRANHPMLRLFTLQQETAKKKMALNTLDGKPAFGVGLDYIMVTPRSDATPMNNGRDIFQLSARVSIPLYRKKYNAKEREEQLRIAALQDRKSDTESLFLATIEKAYTDHEIARLRQGLYTQQKATTEAAIRLLTTEYSTNGRRFDELLLLEMDLVNYDLKTLKAIVQSQLAKARIERYIAF